MEASQHLLLAGAAAAVTLPVSSDGPKYHPSALLGL
jgi:hypothetical protein